MAKTVYSPRPSVVSRPGGEAFCSLGNQLASRATRLNRQSSLQHLVRPWRSLRLIIFNRNVRKEEPPRTQSKAQSWDLETAGLTTVPHCPASPRQGIIIGTHLLRSYPCNFATAWFLAGNECVRPRHCIRPSSSGVEATGARSCFTERTCEER
jgi:hypothetical protein